MLETAHLLICMCEPLLLSTCMNCTLNLQSSEADVQKFSCKLSYLFVQLIIIFSLEINNWRDFAGEFATTYFNITFHNFVFIILLSVLFFLVVLFYLFGFVFLFCFIVSNFVFSPFFSIFLLFFFFCHLFHFHVFFVFFSVFHITEKLQLYNRH